MLNQIDSSIFYIINTKMQCRLFDTIMPVITHYKNWYIVIGIFIAILIRHDHKKAFRALLFAAIAVAVSDAVNHHILKQLFQRTRPCHALSSVHLLGGCTSSYSFPSSHASNTFALCTVLGYEYRKTIILMSVIAISVAYSRVYIGVHYPFDVLFGGLFGFFYSYVILRARNAFAS